MRRVLKVLREVLVTPPVDDSINLVIVPPLYQTGMFSLGALRLFHEDKPMHAEKTRRDVNGRTENLQVCLSVGEQIQKCQACEKNCEDERDAHHVEAEGSLPPLCADGVG